VGVTDVDSDSGRPMSEPWSRFPAWVALETNTPLRAHHCCVVRAVTVDSGGGQNDIQASHTRSNLDSFVGAGGYGVEKEEGPVDHPGPDKADVGLQGGNPVADHVIGMSVSEMIRVRILEWVLGHTVEQGTGIVDPETPVDYSRM